MPPVMPRRGLNVFCASRSPSGTEMTTDTPPDSPHRRRTCSTFSQIMRRGTELMAAAPTGWSRPRFVTRPTPCPPSIVTPGCALRRTEAKTSAPAVTSGSSPLSLRMAHRTSSGVIRISSTGSVSGRPFGVKRSMVSFFLPVSSIHAAALAAAAAQLPVV